MESHKKGYLTAEAQNSESCKVILSQEAYFRMVYHAYQYANPLIDKLDWVEVMGWLSGTFKKNKSGEEILSINQCWSISHGDAISVSIENYGSVLSSILGELEKKNNQSILGWYHTHPGYGLFMSQMDYETQKSYQKLFDKAIAIVLDQTLVSSIHSGLEIFRLKPDLISFEKIPFSYSDSFDKRLLPRILQLYQNNIKSGKTIKEFDN